MDEVAHNDSIYRQLPSQHPRCHQLWLDTPIKEALNKLLNLEHWYIPAIIDITDTL